MTTILGKTISHYQILRELGEGGMATVYLARDTHLNREVALKLIRSDLFSQPGAEHLLKRFEREAQALAKLSHPGIVKVFDFGKHAGIPYLVIEYLPGGTLKQRLGQPMPDAQAARLLLPIARALAEAHCNGVIHRDIKPGNILFNAAGEAQLSDFGIARLIEPDVTMDLTTTGTGIGTPEYMAPEQASGNADERSDIYSLGVVLFEMVTGQKPYSGETATGVMYQHAYEPLPAPHKINPSISAEMENVIRIALEKDPAQRFNGMDAFATALEFLANESNSHPAIQQIANPLRNPKMRVFGLVGMAGILGIAMIWGAFQMLSEGSDQHMAASAREETNSASTEMVTPPTKTVKPTATQTPTVTPFPGTFEKNVKDEADMVLIPAGEFSMGSNEKDDPYFWGAEAPMHKVSLDEYWIYQYEVTNQMYQACVEEKACPIPQHNFSATRDQYFKNSSFNNYPVIYVNWTSAQAYCKWAGGHLPTEAEWEKAARGTDERLFTWGSSGPRGNLLNFCDANCPDDLLDTSQDDGYRDTAPVGHYPNGVSPYGVYDMSGNVAEWVFDWFQPLYYEKSPQENPQGPAYASKNKRVTRGGSYYNPAEGVRVVARYPRPMSEAFDTVGFRCAVDVE